MRSLFCDAPSGIDFTFDSGFASTLRSAIVSSPLRPRGVGQLTYWLSHLNPSPYPCRITTEHMKTSIGRISFRGILPYTCQLVQLVSEGQLTLPVVWYNPSWCRSSSSETAPGASILLPRMRNGTMDKDSIDTARQLVVPK